MNTKKAIYIIGAAMALAGCSDKELASDIVVGITPKSLMVGTSTINFGANENLTATLPIKSQNLAWNLSGEPAWLTVSPKQGSQSADVALTAAENTSVDEARVGVLSLTASETGVGKQIAVSQQQADIVLTPSTTSISANAASSMQYVAITANVEWTATCSDSWLTLERSGSTLNVAISENTGASRTTTILLKRKGTETTLATIQVVQGEAGVTGNTEQLTFDVNGEEKTYTFEADASWTASTSDASWLTVTPTGGSNSVKSVKITALPNMSLNERSGFVYIKIGTTTKLEIPVKQCAVEISVSETTLKYGASAENKTVTVSSNVAWQVLDKPEWITVSPSSGAIGTNEIGINAEANTNSSSRHGIVNFTVAGGTNSLLSIAVFQDGVLITEVPNTLEISSYAQSMGINVVASGPWMVTTDSSDWITLSPTESSGKGTLLIEVTENTADAPRSGTVSIYQPGVQTEPQVIIIIINQRGKEFNVDCSGVITSANACTLTLSVKSGMNWTVSSDVEWLSPSPQHGSCDGDVTVSVAFNPSIAQRDGNITIHADGETQTRIGFNQPGRSFSYNVYRIFFGGNGGESTVVTVQADGDFEVTASQPWITINRQSGANTFTVIADELTDAVLRTCEVLIKLTGVPNGENTLTGKIKVIQAFSNIVLDGFDEEEDWD